MATELEIVEAKKQYAQAKLALADAQKSVNDTQTILQKLLLQKDIDDMASAITEARSLI